MTMEDFMGVLALREENASLILTGKVCPPELYGYADTVTRIDNDVDC